MESQYNDLLFRFREINSELMITHQQWQVYLFSDTAYLPKPIEYEKLDLTTTPQAATKKLLENPEYKTLESKTLQAKQNISLEKSSYVPEIYIGYFNQQIDKITGFSGWEAGISIPLWILPQQQNVQMAKVEFQMVENRQSLYQKR